MIKDLKITLLALFLVGCGQQEQVQNGDIIFHTSKSGQSKAVQLATHSKYSHS